MFVDLNAGTGDMLMAWIMKVSTLTAPCYYFGLTQDACQADWMQQRCMNSLTAMVQSKEITIPGVALPAKPESPDAPPAKPQLKVLVFDAEKKLVRVPQDSACSKMVAAASVNLRADLRSRFRSPASLTIVFGAPVIRHVC